MKLILIGVGAVHICTGASMFIAPQNFYETVPGVIMRGGFNSHFIRDAGLALCVSGVGFTWAATSRLREVAVLDALWPCLHAVLHLFMWITRGLPINAIAMTNVIGIQLPTWLGFTVAVRLGGRTE